MKNNSPRPESAQSAYRIRQEFFEQNLKAWIRRHYSENIGANDVASSMGINPSYFSHKVKKLTGESFTDLLARQRVEAAKALLSDTDLSVREICLNVGYYDAGHFCIFRPKRPVLTVN